MGCSASDGNFPNGSVSMEREQEEPPQNFHDAYFLGPKLGKGAFAQVRLAATNGSIKGKGGVARAVKIIDLRDSKDASLLNKQQVKAARGEATVWKIVGDHRNVIRLYEAFSGDSLCYLVMERCASSLLTFLEKDMDYNEATLGSVLVQMLQALAHVHAARVVHRDVKPDNFLCGGLDGRTVKLGDFGLSVALPKTGGVSGIYGTAPFMCPEMLGDCWYNTKADVWSLGVIAYVLLYGNFPYIPKERSSKAMKQAILDGYPAPKYEPYGRGQQNLLKPTKNAVSFCRKLLARDPNLRPSAMEALKTPFMQEALDYERTSVVRDDLPSLRPRLFQAKKAGAFEVRDPNKEDATDLLLNSLQMKYLDSPLPTALPPATVTISRASNSKPMEGHKNIPTASPIPSLETLPPMSMATPSSTCESTDSRSSNIEL